MKEAVTRLPSPLSLPSRWNAPDAYDEFESQYIGLFEVGDRTGPPCPLHSGHYMSDRLKTLETLVRFYNFFGLRSAPGVMPDHLSVQLEFMSWLLGCEAEAEDSRDRLSYQRAERDFLGGYLAGWLPRLETLVARRNAAPFFRSIVALTSRFVAAERSYLAGTLGHSEGRPPDG